MSDDKNTMQGSVKVPPDGWLHFGELVDYHGPSECSEEVGEDGLPLWERKVHAEVKATPRQAGKSQQHKSLMEQAIELLEHVHAMNDDGWTCYNADGACEVPLPGKEKS